MKIALVHDYLFEQGGAENVVEVFAGMFPDAPIYTSIYAPETMSAAFRRRDVRTSYLQRLTTNKRTAKALLPLYPHAFRRLKLRGYDVVLTSSSSFAKGIDVGDARHICYCYTPPRFLWQTDRYIEQQRAPMARTGMHIVAGMLRARDRRDADNVDQFIAISRIAQTRIARMYQRDSTIIYPPIAVSDFHMADMAAAVEPRFLVVSRLLSYKRIDIVIDACNRLGLPLTVVGDGPDHARLQALAGPTVTMRGRLPRAEVRAYLTNSLALIMPGEEDFGLTPLEANASGRPVVAYRAGGALETVLEGRTGWFFDAQSAESLMPVLARVAHATAPDPRTLRAHARRFDVSVFQDAIERILRAESSAVAA